MSVLSLIASGNFISVNRDLIKAFGIETALLIGELASEYDYYYKREELIDDCFYSTVKNIKENTGLSEHQQRQAFKVLIENGIVEIQKKGMPAKRYVKINEQVFLNIYDKWCKNYSTGALKNEELDVEKLSANNNKEIRINNKNKNKGLRPSLDELSTYIRENNLNVNAQQFVDYYNSNGWKVGKNPMKDWKAAARNWSRREKENKKQLSAEPSFDIDEIERKATFNDDFDI